MVFLFSFSLCSLEVRVRLYRVRLAVEVNAEEWCRMEMRVGIESVARMDGVRAVHA